MNLLTQWSIPSPIGFVASIDLWAGHCQPFGGYRELQQPSPGSQLWWVCRVSAGAWSPSRSPTLVGEIILLKLKTGDGPGGIGGGEALRAAEGVWEPNWCPVSGGSQQVP